MIRTLVGLPALLIALAPQAIVTDAPASEVPSPMPSIANTVQASAPTTASGGGLVFQGPVVGAPQPQSVLQPMVHMQHVMDLERTFRQLMLAALTPMHRAILGQIIGELAISPNPQLDAATRRLNAVLSPAEAQAIVRVEQAQQAAMQQAVQQFIATESGGHLPALVLHSEVHAAPPRAMSGAAFFSAPAPFGNDAGSILLRTAAQTLMMPNTGVSGHLSP